MSLGKAETDNLSPSEEANEKKTKTKLIKEGKDTNKLFSREKTLKSASKEERIIPIFSQKPNTSKITRKRTSRNTKNNKVLTTSENFGSSPGLAGKESNLKVISDSMSNLSRTLCTADQISNALGNNAITSNIKLNEKLPSTVCNTSKSNITAFPIVLPHQSVQLVSDCSIPVLTHENNIDIKKTKQFTSYESTFSSLSTLPDTAITFNTNLLNSLDLEKTDSAELHNSDLNSDLYIFENNSVVSTDVHKASEQFSDLQDAFSSNSESSKKSSELLFHKLISNAKPLIKPPDLNYEQNLFCCSLDISLIKAAAEECAYQTGTYPAIFSDNDCATVWQNSNVKPSDLSLSLFNFTESDLNISNSEDNESEISISSLKTVDIQPEFFDLTFAENPEKNPESFQNSDVFPSTLGINTDESLCIMPENQLSSDNNLTLQPNIISPSTSSPKKRKRKRYPCSKKQKGHKKQMIQMPTNITTTADFEPSVELCDTCEESGAEDTLDDLNPSNYNLNVEKKENIKRILSHDQLTNLLEEATGSAKNTDRISNFENNESENISGNKTVDTQPEFFYQTISKNPEKVSKNFPQESSAVFPSALGINMAESLSIMPENELPCDNLHLKPNIITPSTPPPKKRKRRRNPYTKRRRCRKKQVTADIVTTSKFEPSVELCDTCDETEPEDTLDDLNPLNSTINVKKKENSQRNLSCNQLKKNKLNTIGPVQRTERYNLRRRCKKKDFAEIVSEESSLKDVEQLCDTCDESDSEEFNESSCLKELEPVKAKNIESSQDIQNNATYVVVNKRDDTSLENNSRSKAEFPMLSNSENLVFDELECDINIHELEPKKVGLHKKEHQLKCSISLAILDDNSVKNHKRSVAVTELNNSDGANQIVANNFSKPYEKEMATNNLEKTKDELIQIIESQSVTVVVDRLNKSIVEKYEISKNVYVDKDFCINSGIIANCDNISSASVVEQFPGNQNSEFASVLSNTYSEEESKICALAEDYINFCETFSPPQATDIGIFASHSNVAEENSCSSLLPSLKTKNDKNSKNSHSESPVKNLSNIRMNSKGLPKKSALKKKCINKTAGTINNFSFSDMNCNDNICLPSELSSEDLKNANSNFDLPLELRSINDASTAKSVHPENPSLENEITILGEVRTCSSVSPAEQNKCPDSKKSSVKSKTVNSCDTFHLSETSSGQKEKNGQSDDLANLNSNICDIQNSENNDSTKNHLRVDNFALKSPEKTRPLKKAKKNKTLVEESSECAKQSNNLKDIHVKRLSKSDKIKSSKSKCNLKENTKKSLSDDIISVETAKIKSISKLPQIKISEVLNSPVLSGDSSLCKENLSEEKLKNVNPELSLNEIEDRVNEENSGSVFKTKLCDDIQTSVQPLEDCENSLDNSEPIILNLSDEELDQSECGDSVYNSSYRSLVHEHLDKIVKLDSRDSTSVTDYKGNEIFSFLNDTPNYFASNFRSYENDSLSEDDSESDKSDHGYKRNERRNNFIEGDIDEKRNEQNEVLQNNEIPLINSDDYKKSEVFENGKAVSINSDDYKKSEVFGNGKAASINSDDYQKPNSACGSSKSSVCSEKSKVTTESVRRLEDVAVQIKDFCEEDRVQEALNFAETYMKISSSASANKFIFKILLTTLLSYVRSYSGVKEFSSFTIFDKVLNVMANFDLFSKQFCSYYLVNCCFYPELNTCSVKIFDICKEKKIPLSIDAINAFSSFLKSDETSLSVMLGYVNYVKDVCNKKIPKDITHQILEKSKACNAEEMHKICSILNNITSKEVDRNVLEDFLVMCFKKSMWSYVADMFVMWNKNKKISLMYAILYALAVESENIGKYYGKFASAVDDLEEELLSNPEHKKVLGSFGVCLMLLLLEEKRFEIAYEILDVLHKKNVNYLYFLETIWKFHDSVPSSRYEGDPKNVPYYVVFTAIDICLHLKKSKDAFTIFQDFKWIKPDNIISEAVRSYVIRERYQRLLKLTVLLNSQDTINQGYEAMTYLVNAVEQGMTGDEDNVEKDSDPDLQPKEKLPSVRSIYNKYLVNLMDSKHINYVLDLYRHSLGPKKDVFILNLNVLRGLVVTFSNHDMDDKAKCIFMYGLVNKIYSVQMTEFGSFPWGITIRSYWTTPEIKLVIEWFVRTLFSLLLERPKEENFEDWFSLNILFEKTDFMKPEGSFSQCLLETSCDIKDCIKRTKDALQNMSPSLDFTEKVNEQALLITSTSLYNYYWKNRCSDASSNSCVCSRPPFELKKKRFVFGGVILSFGDNLSTSLNQTPKTSFKVQPAEDAVSDLIDDIQANNLSPTYTPMSPKSSPYKMNKNIDISPNRKFENETGKKTVTYTNKIRSDLHNLSNSPSDSSTPYKSTILVNRQQKIGINNYMFTSPQSVTYRKEKFEDPIAAKSDSFSYNTYRTPGNIFKETEELVTNKNLDRISSERFFNQPSKLNPVSENKLKTCDLTPLSCNTLPSHNLIPLSMPSKKKKLKLNNSAISKNIVAFQSVNSNLQTQKEIVLSKKHLKKKVILKKTKVVAKMPKNSETKKTHFKDLKNLKISFVANSNNRVVSDSSEHKSTNLVSVNSVNLQSVNKKGPLRKLNSQSSVKQFQDSKITADAAKCDILKPEKRNLNADTLIIKTFTQNTPNQSKLSDASKILIKIPGSDQSSQKSFLTSKEQGIEVCKSNENSRNDGNSSQPSVSNKTIPSTSPSFVAKKTTTSTSSPSFVEKTTPLTNQSLIANRTTALSTNSSFIANKTTTSTNPSSIANKTTTSTNPSSIANKTTTSTNQSFIANKTTTSTNQSFIANKTTTTTNSSFGANKSQLKPFKPKIKRDLVNVNKNIACTKTSVTLEPKGITDHLKLPVNPSSLELEKKKQIVPTSKRLECSENAAQKTDFTKLHLGNLCPKENLDKIVTYIKMKVTQKHKHLSSEEVHQKALALSQNFMEIYDFRTLDSRARKLLMEFTMSNV